MSSSPSKQLQEYWNQKLKDSGFKDIENPDGFLKEWVSSRILPSRNHNRLKIVAKENYYRLVGNFLYDYKYFTMKEKDIWVRHGEGFSLNEIAKDMGISKAGAHLIVKQLKIKMFAMYGVK